MYQIISFREIGDHRGSLIAIEGNKNIPFKIARMYYIFNTGTDVIRGQHAHKHLKQILICLNGSCMLRIDNGKHTEDLYLNDRTKGIYLDSMIWREMYQFSSDCVLLVLASKNYDEADYIRDYFKFKELCKGELLYEE